MATYSLIRTAGGERVARPAEFERRPNNYSRAAKFYDLDNDGKLNEDVPFYLEMCETIKPNRILDLCCGTGRVAIELAKAGYEVVGLDTSLPMLDVFEQKVLSLSPEVSRRINIICGNAVDFKLDTKFDLIIMPYRSFQQFAHRSEARASLRCIKMHLTENGRFILTTYHPKKVMDSSWIYPKTKQWTKPLGDGSEITKYHWGKKIDTEEQLIYPVVCYEISNQSGVKDVIYEDLTLKYYFYDELILMIKAADFEILEEYGSYSKASIENGLDFIFILR